AQPDDPQFQAFSRALLLVPEHTWGMDEKIYLDDYQNYTRVQFDSLRISPRYQTFVDSWAEQRAYIDTAIAALDGTVLADQARAALRRLTPARPNAVAMQRVPAPSEHIVGAQLSIAIDAQTGAITQLTERASGRDWA
ncbi:MAG: DUF5054 domain-containing protein, partial [Chloroflexota bacterium]|nr:DUF5054 domain-containing protein [Chloroflexota bacterium]